MEEITTEPKKLPKCAGKIRTNLGTWYVPEGKTPREYTICEWCYSNGCTQGVTVIEFSKLFNCNCDCPLDHPLSARNVTYDHVECLQKITTCDMVTCAHCGGSSPTTCCKTCSLLLECCTLCGQTNTATIIQPRVCHTKMLSHVNGRI